MKASADYETKDSYTFDVVANDATAALVTKSVTVSVTNDIADDTPTAPNAGPVFDIGGSLFLVTGDGSSENEHKFYPVTLDDNYKECGSFKRYLLSRF